MATDELPSPDILSPGAGPVSSDEYWYHIGAMSSQTQGWKLYVSFAPHNAVETLQHVVPLLARHLVSFKYVRSLSTLLRLNSGHLGYSQIGKSLVCYLPNERQTVVYDLFRVLSGLSNCTGPVVPYARRLRAQLPVYYRFGAYVDSYIVVDGHSVQDDRCRFPFVVPSNAIDWLSPLAESGFSNRAPHPFLLRYPVFKAIRQHGKSGVFAALDLSAPRYCEVILKMGYRFGALQPDGTDGCSFLRNEIHAYRQLGSIGLSTLTPKMIDSLEEVDRAILVLEKIEGDDLLSLMLRCELELGDLKRAWRILCLLNGAGFLVGDAKIANFMRGPDGRIFIIDLESVSRNKREGPRQLSLRTFDVIDGKSANANQSDKLHFLASVAFDYTSAVNVDVVPRKIDLHQCSLAHHPPDIANWIADRLREVS